MPTELKFLDSNIWLYALIKEQDADKHSIARELAKQSGIAVSTQIINEVCFNLYRNKIQTETEWAFLEIWGVAGVGIFTA